MFGYVKVYQDELKVKEYNLYRAYYCGLCFTTKYYFGNIPRLVQSNDVVFLDLLLSSLFEKDPDISQKRCVLNPFKKRPVVTPTASSEFAAAVNIILAYFKIKDDFKDGFSPKALCALPFLLPSVKKSKKRYKKVFDVVCEKLNDLSSFEKDKCGNLDKVAHCFAELLAELFSAYPTDDKTKKILYRIGYSLGRFIYIADAVNDLEEDTLKKRYNPLIYTKDLNMHDLKDSLLFTLSDISLSYELLDIKRNKNLLDNIIYLGLNNSYENVFKTKECKLQKGRTQSV